MFFRSKPSIVLTTKFPFFSLKAMTVPKSTSKLVLRTATEMGDVTLMWVNVLVTLVSLETTVLPVLIKMRNVTSTLN